MIKIKNDGPIDLATASHRKAVKWKNAAWDWSDLVKRISTTHRTAETYAEYMKFKKPRQDEIKDVGGFVGGYLTGGKRGKHSILHRQLVCLDVDFGSMAVWDLWKIMYGCAAAVYSTHKHGPKAPRLRILIPLDREVDREEYEAISRRIAQNLDIEIFDPTTHQPNRLMYWPSSASDGEYVFKYCDGPWLSADNVLATYRDWMDSSSWAFSSRENSLIHNGINKQGDPLEKPGLIGAFCRSYSISEAIETFLEDVYEECDIEDRYTYSEATTSAGLVVYEDKYAFSHHGSDPVSGKLCNAFDLVRLHLFGLQDQDAGEDTATNKLPSYTAMNDLCSKDKQVRKLVNQERRAEALEDFTLPEDTEFTAEDEQGQPLETEEEVNDDWLSELDMKASGENMSTINNVVMIMRNDSRLRGKLGFNEFEKREVALGHLPWRRVKKSNMFLTDADDASIRHYLENVYNVKGLQTVRDGVMIALQSNSFHPVKDYLATLKWDGEHRLDTLLVDYMGADDTDYVRAVTRKALVAAVARIYRPGVKFDYVLTLVGEEGKGKSTLIDKLGGEWFSDSFSTVTGKDAYESIQGVWLVEIAELAGLKKSEVEVQKHFIGKRIDRYRVAFGRRVEIFPRQCTFWASTNDKRFLISVNGNRRFWPVDIWVQEPQYDIFTDFTAEIRAQLWAEAMHFYKQGETLCLDREMEDEAKQHQKEHTEIDERTGMIQEYLRTLLPSNWDKMTINERSAYLQSDEDELKAQGVERRTSVCVPEIMCELFRMQIKDINKYNTKDVHNIIKNIPGWTTSGKKARFRHYGIQLRYEKGIKTVNRQHV